MYLGKGPPRRKTGSNPIRVLALLVLIAAGLYLLTIKPEAIPQPFSPTPTPTRTAASYVTEAENLYQEGQLDEAIATYEQAIRCDPTLVENYIPLARLLVYESRLEEALDYANTALFVDPDYAPARAVRALALDWKSAELRDEGLEEDATDLLLEALGEVNRAIERDSALAEAYAIQAEILFDLDNYQQADESIQNALLVDPDNLDVQRVAGYLNEFRGYRQQAIEHYLKAITIHPNLSMLHLALGRTYIGAGEIDLARASLVTAIDLEPDNAQHYYFLGYAYFTINEQELAAEYFKQAIELKPDYPSAHCQLGLILYRQRNWEGAIPELETSLEGYGDRVTYRNAFCYYTLGLSYFYLARCEDAYPLFDLVLEFFPDNPSALDGIRLCREAEAQDIEIATPTP